MRTLLSLFTLAMIMTLLWPLVGWAHEHDRANMTPEEIRQADRAADALPDCPPEPTFEERAAEQAKHPIPPVDVTSPEVMRRSREAFEKRATEGPTCLDPDLRQYYYDYRHFGRDQAEKNAAERLRQKEMFKK